MRSVRGETDIAIPERPHDPNQLTKLIVDMGTEEVQDKEPNLTEPQKFARWGGIKGSPTRCGALSTERRSDVARNDAKPRSEKTHT